MALSYMNEEFSGTIQSMFINDSSIESMGIFVNAEGEQHNLDDELTILDYQGEKTADEQTVGDVTSEKGSYKYKNVDYAYKSIQTRNLGYVIEFY